MPYIANVNILQLLSLLFTFLIKMPTDMYWDFIRELSITALSLLSFCLDIIKYSPNFVVVTVSPATVRSGAYWCSIG